MDRILIPNGGMPFTGDDLLWIQNGLRGGVAGFGRHFGNGQSVVISGVQVSIVGFDFTYTEGYVIIDDEILYLPAGTAVGGAPDPDRVSIELDSTFDPTGLDVFGDLVARDTYEKRRAKVVVYAVGTPPANAITFDIIEERRYNAVVTPTLVNSWVGLAPLKIRRFGKVVAFEGLVVSGTEDSVCFNVPVGFRPTAVRRFPTFEQTLATGPVLVNVFPNGDVTITSGFACVIGVLLHPVCYIVD